MSLAITARFFKSHPLTRDAQWRAWGRFAVWQLKSRLQGEVIHPWIEGQKLAVTRGMAGATGNIYAGLHEFTDMMLVLHYLREDDLFIDVGANVGTFTVLASGVCKGRSIALEPDPWAMRALRRNLELNGLMGRIEALEMAAGASRSEVNFTTSGGTTNAVVDYDGAQTRRVRQDTLDAIVGSRMPAMIKIDAEGYEEQVLSGASDVLAKPSLKLIISEGLSPLIEAQVGNAGFKRVYYDPHSRALLDRPSDTHPADPVFARDIPFVLRRLADARPVQVLGETI